jgi:transposase
VILLPATRPLFAAADPVDMRRSFDHLVAIAREQLGLDVMRSAVVLYFSRDLLRCKLLFHDGSGFVLLYKRLDQHRFVIPMPVLPGDRSVAIEPRELALLLEGHIRHRP